MRLQALPLATPPNRFSTNDRLFACDSDHRNPPISGLGSYQSMPSGTPQKR
jgi:hypothetical protein